MVESFKGVLIPAFTHVSSNFAIFIFILIFIFAIGFNKLCIPD